MGWVGFKPWNGVRNGVRLVSSNGMGSKMVNLGMFWLWGWWKLGWVDPKPWDGVKKHKIGDISSLGLVEVGLGWSDPMGWGQKWWNLGIF